MIWLSGGHYACWTDAVRRLLVWTRWATLSWEQMAEGSSSCVDTDPDPHICQGASPKCRLTVPCHLHRSEYSMSMFGFRSSQNKHQVRKRHPTTSRQNWQGGLYLKYTALRLEYAKVVSLKTWTNLVTVWIHYVFEWRNDHSRINFIRPNSVFNSFSYKIHLSSLLCNSLWRGLLYIFCLRLFAKYNSFLGMIHNFDSGQIYTQAIATGFHCMKHIIGSSSLCRQYATLRYCTLHYHSFIFQGFETFSFRRIRHYFFIRFSLLPQLLLLHNVWYTHGRKKIRQNVANK